MIKVVVLVCSLMPQLQCTESTAKVVILADREDDGTPCRELGHLLVKQLGRPETTKDDTILVACQKDGKEYK
jgi:hypothetical protein